MQFIGLLKKYLKKLSTVKELSKKKKKNFEKEVMFKK